MSFLQSCLELESLELEWLERQTVQVEKKRAEALSPGSTRFSLRLPQKGLTVNLTSSGKPGKKASLICCCFNKTQQQKSSDHPRYHDL